MILKITLSFLAIAFPALGWEALPQIPSGHRAQFLVLHENGGYKYGYDTGDGIAAKQTADASNQVSGHYTYKNNLGQDVDVKYLSGVQGFIPERSENLQAIGYAPAQWNVKSISGQVNQVDNQANTGDASYNFAIDTDSYKRHETSDARGNIQGSYSYVNKEGVHDLQYVAGENTGFVATSGSLSTANGLKTTPTIGKLNVQSYSAGAGYTAGSSVATGPNADGSYSFSYSTGDSSRQETADANNNVQGKYSYNNEAGTHELSYLAGSETGFKLTGGSLAQPNGLATKSSQGISAFSEQSQIINPQVTISQPSSDGSYSFSYNIKDQARQETADASGNVQGRYSYQDNAGNHDLSYAAGDKTGFQVTGGNLALPNGLPTQNLQGSAGYSATFKGAGSFNNAPSIPQASNDGSYSFGFNAGDQSRQETSDAAGNVQGSYSYQNNAGSHDLSYQAGAKTGFQVTGGNLAQPNGLPAQGSAGYSATFKDVGSFNNVPSIPQASNDGSYSFGFNIGDQSRQEASDAAGNVQGSYSYQNNAGTHDLSYQAGAETGFVVTGGSLAQLNETLSDISQGISGKLDFDDQTNLSISNSILAKSGSSEENQDNLANTGDSSYSFTIDTDEYKRHETSDASGNVQGSYTYKNAAGVHDLSYIAGSETGFVGTSGTLKTAPGLTEGQLQLGQSKTPALGINTQSARTFGVNTFLPLVKSSSKAEKAVLHLYLPPSNEKKKFGYIYESS